MNRLFPPTRQVERDPPLALGVLQNFVHFAETDHEPMCAKEGIVGVGVGEGLLARPEKDAVAHLRGMEGVIYGQFLLKGGQVLL